MACLSRTTIALLLAEVFLLALTFESGTAKPMDREYIDPLQLSTFKGYKYDYSLGSNGIYQFYYSLPTSSRQEERLENGDVRGSYSFIAPEGDEFDFQYQADKRGFRVQSDALPVMPKDTEEVRKAKEEFFELYKKALELVSSSEDDSEEDDSEEDDSDEESSEESDEDDESSEESSEEDSSEESDEDEEEEEEEEEGNKGHEERGLGKQLQRLQQLKKPVFVSRPQYKSVSNKKRGGSSFKRPLYNTSLPPKKLTSRQSSPSYGTKVPSRKSYYYAK